MKIIELQEEHLMFLSLNSGRPTNESPLLCLKFVWILNEK